MIDEHPDRELAPRDVVARAIWRLLMAGRRVFLDAREAVGDQLPERFPTVFELCRRQGLDPRREPMPVSPAAHYHMGGIAVDGQGRTSLEGLWACGEVSSTGVHGANRLASNSLLEALVFGSRVAEDLRSFAGRGASGRGFLSGRRVPAMPAGTAQDAGWQLAIRRTMWEKVGVMRDAQGLSAALGELEGLARSQPAMAGEARNLLTVGRLVTAAALARRESRGGHHRCDHPRPDPDWQRRIYLTAAPDGSAVLEEAPMPEVPAVAAMPAVPAISAIPAVAR